jgi:hypothetical protein
MELLVNGALKGIWINPVLASTKHHAGILLEGVRRTI